MKLPKDHSAVVVARFRREVEIVQQVQHPAIVRLLDVCLDDDALGYISPLGIPLDRYWKTVRNELNPTQLYDRAGEFMTAIAEGLALIHQREVIHRDLKAGNIIVLEDEGRPRPVVIDFGLAFRPGDERLSIVDGRRVRNVDAAPAEAYYRHIEPTTAWDCIGLGWLYGYLVGAGQPDEHRFHWKYHPLVPEARADRVRSLLATCSDLDYAPQNAAGFRLLMDSLGLGAQAAPVVPFVVNADGARVAMQEGRAARDRLAVEQAELHQVCARLFHQQFTRVRELLNQRAAAIRDLPIVLNQNHTTPDLAGRDFDEHFRAAFGGDRESRTCFFCATCGTPPYRHFFVAAWLEYEPNPAAGFLPFHLLLLCYHGDRQFPEKRVNYLFKRDGTFWTVVEGVYQQVDLEGIVGVSMNWLTENDHWRTAS